MNISRSISRLLSSSATRKWSISRPTPLLHPSSPLSTRTLNRNPSLLRKPGKKAEFPRPSEIPYQAKVANAVHLVGTIGVPIELQRLSNGDYAVSVLVQEKSSPKLWLPVIFQGDLAQIAACHLKENDLVYVTGQLIGEEPSLAVQDAKTRSQVQVLVNSVSFVQKPLLKNKDDVLDEQDEVASNSSDTCSASSSEQVFTLLSHKGRVSSRGMKGLDDRTESLWWDLVDNPQQWWDNRVNKENGSIKPRSPDFSHKVTKNGLWLNSAPSWVSAKLDTLLVDKAISRTFSMTKDNSKAVGQKLEKEELWKNLVENPSKWWDNRFNKLNPKAPDFKCKDTGEGLWLDSFTPSWVSLKLTPAKSKQVGDSKKNARKPICSSEFTLMKDK